MAKTVWKGIKAAVEPLTDELGAVPAGAGMGMGWMAICAMALVLGIGGLAPASADDEINCEGCWLAQDECATYRCDDNNEKCPTYPPVAKHTVTAILLGGHSLQCLDNGYTCVTSANCNANCGSCN